MSTCNFSLRRDFYNVRDKRTKLIHRRICFNSLPKMLDYLLSFSGSYFLRGLMSVINNL